jgi:hypothetical protein
MSQREPLKFSSKYNNCVMQLARIAKPDLIEAWIPLMSSSNRDFWECLRYVWTHSEGASNNKEFWLNMFGSMRPGKQEWLITKEEAEYLNGLPEMVTVFRGSSINKVNGLSWTTDKAKAIWFGDRFNFGSGNPPFDKPCCVTTGQIARADIFAVFLNRQESEIVCDPKKVKRKSKEILPPRKV